VVWVPQVEQIAEDEDAVGGRGSISSTEALNLALDRADQASQAADASGSQVGSRRPLEQLTRTPNRDRRSFSACRIGPVISYFGLASRAWG
jgi:hypothetical protein